MPVSPPASLQAIAHLAGLAHDIMVRDRAAGEVQFQRLLARYPGDGMVYYERAEAYRQLGQYALSLADYERAVPLLQLKESKQRALDAAAELHQRLSGGMAGALADARRRLERLQLPDLLLSIAVLEALELVDQQPARATAMLRDCLARFLDQAQGKAVVGHGDLRARLTALGERAPLAVVQHLQLVYVLGNLSAHPRPDQPLTVADAYGSLNGLLCALEWWEGS
jgi:tetratricopeptide (TPR) repeat protein